MSRNWDFDAVYSMLRHVERNVDYNYFLDPDWYDTYGPSPIPSKEDYKLVALAPEMKELLDQLALEGNEDAVKLVNKMGGVGV